MRPKLYWGITFLILLGISGFSCLSVKDSPDFPEAQTEYNQPSEDNPSSEDNPPSEDLNVSKPPPPGETDETGHWHRTAPADVDVSKPDKNTKYATEPLGYEKEGVDGLYVTHMPRDPSRFADNPPPPLPPSSVPDDCPDHLKFLPEWIDGVYRNIEPPPPDDQLTDEIKVRIGKIMMEIVREHNPKRPYAEIWDQFIEYEKMYRAYAEYELGYTPSSTLGGNRFDWIYEQAWAFPEFFLLGMSTSPQPFPGEENRFIAAYNIAMGFLNQDWNKITLKDGRDFFIKGNTRYEFVYEGVTEEGDAWKNVTGFSRVRLTKDTPVVNIDVLNTSDEELEALMGWDYTINPITMQPLKHDSSFVSIFPR